MFCCQCGAENPDNGKFCITCGVPLAGKAAIQNNQQPSGVAPTEFPQPTMQQFQPVIRQPLPIGSNAAEIVVETNFKPNRIMVFFLEVISVLVFLFDLLMVMGGAGGVLNIFLLMVSISLTGWAQEGFNKAKKCNTRAEYNKEVKSAKKCLLAAVCLTVIDFLILGFIYQLYG